MHHNSLSSETGSARAWVRITSEKALRCARFKRGEDPFLDARHFELVYCGDNGKVVCIEGHKNGEFHEKWVHDRADYQRYAIQKSTFEKINLDLHARVVDFMPLHPYQRSQYSGTRRRRKKRMVPNITQVPTASSVRMVI